MENTQADTRRLAAIMFTDMVGFSALTQQDEAKAMRLLKEHNATFRELIPNYNGREVKSTGDGFLIEFPSALEAAQAALQIQQSFHDRNLVEQDKINVRIGIHVGDVVEREGDIFGDGVNIAARIEPLAETGGICVSAAVAQQVSNKIDRPLVSLGNKNLKNIDEPFEVHKVFMPWEHGAPKKKQKLNIKWVAAVVAVMAIAITWAVIKSNAQPKPEVLTESQRLTNQALDLIYSPLAYRESFVNAKEIAQKAFEADPVDGEAYAVCAQALLIHLEHYRDRTPERVQNAVSYVERAEQLAPDSVETKIARFYLEKFQDDHEAILKMHSLADEYPEDIRVIRVIAEDVMINIDLEDPNSLAQYEVWRDRADALVGKDYYTRSRRAIMLWINNRYPESIALLNESLDAAPSTEGYHWMLMNFVIGLGDLEEGKEWIAKLPKELKKEDRILFLSFQTYLWGRQPDDALEALENWTRPFIEQDRIVDPVGSLRGRAHMLAGRTGAARTEFQSALEAVEERLEDDPNNIRYLSMKADLHARLGNIEEAKIWADLSSELAGNADSMFELHLGNQAPILDDIELEITERNTRGLLLYQAALHDPDFDILRDNPRFIELMKVGEEWFQEVVDSK